MVCNKKRKPVLIKRKWNYVVFSRVIILSFHPVFDNQLGSSLISSVLTLNADLLGVVEDRDGVVVRELKPLDFDNNYLHINSLSMDDNIYTPPLGLSTLVKEFSAAARIRQGSTNELSTLVSDKV